MFGDANACYRRICVVSQEAINSLGILINDNII